MHKKKLAEEAELTNGNIGAPGSLQTLDATDTHSDMSSLDHGDIVGTIADGKQERF